MAFLFRDNRRYGTDGQTDGAKHLMRPLGRVTLCITVQYKVTDITTRSPAVARIADSTAKNCRGHVT